MTKFFCDKCKPNIRKLLQYTRDTSDLYKEGELMLKDLEMGELEERIYKLEEAIKFAMKATVSKTIRDKCKEALESNKSN